MANTIQKNTILDGPRHAIIQAWFASDGVTGELSDEVLVDVSALSVAEGQTSISSLVVEKIFATTSGAAAELDFDRTTNQGIIELPTDSEADYDFRKMGGGVYDHGTGSTGDIIMSTTGFADAGDDISIQIQVRKKYTV